MKIIHDLFGVHFWKKRQETHRMCRVCKLQQTRYMTFMDAAYASHAIKKNTRKKLLRMRGWWETDIPQLSTKGWNLKYD